MADTFGASRRLRSPAITDDACQEKLCLLSDARMCGAQVAQELSTRVRLYGKPACIVGGNGTWCTYRAVLKWASESLVEWQNIGPGKPPQKELIKSFNGSLCDELFKEQLFGGLADVWRKLAVWRYDYAECQAAHFNREPNAGTSAHAFLEDGSVTTGSLVSAVEYEYVAVRHSL